MAQLHKRRIGEILMQRRVITPDQLNAALVAQSLTGQKIGQVLIQSGYINEEQLLRALATHHQVSAWFLDREMPQSSAVEKLPISFCEQHLVLPVEARGDLLLVAMADPEDLDTIEKIRKLTGLRIEPVVADEHRLERMIEEYALSARDASGMDDHLSRAIKEARPAEASDVNNLHDEDERPVVALANEFLTLAIRMRASDVHLEPGDRTTELRFRLDGQLHTIREIPASLHNHMVTRLKIMAEMDIVEQRLPQDGHISAFVDGRSVDLRVSTVPSVHGERMVLRILDRFLGLRKLQDIGMDEERLQVFHKLVHKPYGLFLVTGPTGSGKTSTLYAALQDVKTSSNNIMTVEDPVEYEMPGIAQTQVHEKIGLTFAKQLRAILRQDPDVILVGEIRDQETAITAIRASLTGHMVFSTLHCNDSLSAIPRLLDMSVEPYLLSTSLVGVMAQRLVRKLCVHCRVEAETSLADALLIRQHLGLEAMPSTWTSSGCSKCARTGYRGRVAVTELLPIDEKLGSLIAHRATTDELRAHADGMSFFTLQQDVLRRVVAGETSFAEARRVVSFQEIGIADPWMHRQAA